MQTAIRLPIGALCMFVWNLIGSGSHADAVALRPNPAAEQKVDTGPALGWDESHHLLPPPNNNLTTMENGQRMIMPRSRGGPIHNGMWRIFWASLEEPLQFEWILLQMAWDIPCTNPPRILHRRSPPDQRVGISLFVLRIVITERLWLPALM